jgi:NAD+ kinase
MEVKKVGIILRKNSEEPKVIAEELRVWFAEREIDTVIDQVSEDLDLLVILGGDGTLLQVAEQASSFAIPVVGINLGDLGFLTEVASSERLEALDAILSGGLQYENRMMLKVRLCSDGCESEWFHALNDVVITKGDIDQLIRLGAWADQDYITTYRADGLIFSTPTGATAYNLSAGGPIVHPNLNSILVTPICPFMLDSRPVLLSPETKLTTRLVGGSGNVKVIIDGKVIWDMRENDVLEVRSADKPLQLIGSPQKDYFEILRNKLNWGGSERVRSKEPVGKL